MKSDETHVKKESDYYIYSPSKIARDTFLYPICTGHFLYEEGYLLERNRFDSFLLAYVVSGTLLVHGKNTSGPVEAGQFLLLDCYEPHSYRAPKDCELFWLHFDGITARSYYDLITGRLGTVFSLKNAARVTGRLTSIFQIFAQGISVQEALLSKYITDILTEPLLCGFSSEPSLEHHGIEDVISYISQHLSEPLCIETLCEKISLSPYYFIRFFKKKTGFTPHQYVLNARIDMARYLLANTELSIKEICFRTGFSNESAFSTAFKKATGISPAQYRRKI